MDRAELVDAIRAFACVIDDKESDARVACDNFLDDLPDPDIDVSMIERQFRSMLAACDAGYHSSEPIEGDWMIQAGWAEGVKAREWSFGKGGE